MTSISTRGVLRDSCDLDCAARGIASLGEESAVHGVHCGEVIHIRKENRSLDDAVHSAAGSLKDTADIGRDCLVCASIPSGNFPVLGSSGELTRNKKHVPNAHSLRIRAYRAGAYRYLSVFFIELTSCLLW